MGEEFISSVLVVCLLLAVIQVTEDEVGAYLQKSLAEKFSCIHKQTVPETDKYFLTCIFLQICTNQRSG